ncbi:2-dehydro-3-deoxygalactonokinase (plasmid) [Paracoccus sp. TD-10]|uniref:2-dehydro-3-deoxygalactonokinase n=1 Tax=Paracoccus sp. TD-10 TaxID=3395918 RepID=UPI003AAE6F83
MDSDGQVLDQRRSDQGMIRCKDAADFQATLDQHLQSMGCGHDVPVIACGMVGARQGWIEAPYMDTGEPLDRLALHAVRAPHPVRLVLILPGVAQRDPLAPDVMRGEETLILGMLDGTPALIGQPGTHCKWIEVDGQAILRFSTHMTGELFALLSRHSTLAGLLQADAAINPDGPAFTAAVDRALADRAILPRLFALRAGGLLGMADPAGATAALSGLLIGAEIASLPNEGRKVRLLAAGPAAALYRSALTRARIDFDVEDAETLTRRGLLRAARHCDWTQE